MSDFGIYVHWPFCAAKCPYCDFNSHVRTNFDELSWARAILCELGWVRQQQQGPPPSVESIFFGGGTPSLLSGAAIGVIVEGVARLWSVAANCEISLEANPASAEAAHFRDYRHAGVNRLSLGVQALNDADLKFLGRLHDTAEAVSALSMAMSVFDRVSLDLIYARPRQSARAWRAELAQALAFGTEHLSLYQLTIEPGTPFAARRDIAVPDEDCAVALFELTQEMTAAAGRPAYEISNFAARGCASRHNLNYWRYGDYAGVGPGAHGRLTLAGRRVGTIAERLPERWQARVREAGHGYVNIAEISDTEAAQEHLLMNLRLNAGLDLRTYHARWGIQIERARIEALAEEGLVACQGDILSATPTGRLLLNRVIATLAA